MNKPRILIFIDWFFPGYKAGGPTTSNVNIVDHLHSLYDFYIITTDTDYHSDTPYKDISANCWMDRGNCKVWYCSKGNLNWKSIKQAAEQAQCPVWYINGIYSKYFSIFPLFIARTLKPQKVIVAPRGMLSPQTFTAKPTLKKIFFRLMKILTAYNKVIFHGTNEEECNHIRNLLSSENICIPIANLPRKGLVNAITSDKKDGEIRLVSFARISPEKNTLYAIKALAHCNSNVYYDIYGQVNSENYWTECKNEIAQLPPNIQVRYNGTIPPSAMSQLYKKYDVMYLPTTGENFGHAILESFINSRPVIISDRTPWKNLQNMQVGFDLPLDNPDNFSKTIDLLANINCEDFNVLCTNCFKFSQKICSDTELKSKYATLFSPVSS